MKSICCLETALLYRRNHFIYNTVVTMIKAVFFDLYQTLIRYEPPREELQARALNDFGIKATPESLRRPLTIADEFIYQEHARLPIGKRTDEEKRALYAQYQGIVLKEAGIASSKELIIDVLSKIQKFKFSLVLFDDVLPALSELKSKGLILGLISNVDHDIAPLCQKLGLSPLLQIVVTSQDTGFNKPHPEIFKEAVRQASIQAKEAMYVGDQYQIDIIGANGAGLHGVLLDRGGYFNQITDCLRIRSLSQLVEHLP